MAIPNSAKTSASLSTIQLDGAPLCSQRDANADFTRAASDHIGHESIQADACKQHRKRSSNLRHKMKINERLVQEPGALYSKCIRLVRGRRHRGRGQRRWR
jgi:hypothetical protein